MKAVLHSFAYSLDFLREQIADVSAAEMAAQPGGIVNHPAWVIGHLTHICQELGAVIGVTPWLPGDWARRFGSGSAPVPDTVSYPTREAALRMLRDARSRITHAVEQLEESRLDHPFPGEALGGVFPSIRHFLTQVLVAHSAYHVGQIGVWRRAMSLPPLARSFE